MKKRTILILFGSLFAISVLFATYETFTGEGGLLSIEKVILEFKGFQRSTATPIVIRPEVPADDPTLGNNKVENKFPGLGLVMDTPIPPTPTIETTTETLQLLEQTYIPINDPIDLAWRLKGIKVTSNIYPDPLKPYTIGASKDFWVLNSDSEVNFTVKATLQQITDHAYFWVDNTVNFNQENLSQLANAFESQIYPTNRAFFGSEWSPGVDDDERIHILYAGELGKSVAGFYAPKNEFPPQVFEHSNAHEIFLLNADNIRLSDEFTYGVLAHEFQHMIHWYNDRNEETWLNEGFSEIAMHLNGYGIGGFEFIYANNPDIQLNYWPGSDESPSPHYGASYLFLIYLMNRFGNDLTQKIVAEQANGLTSIDLVLQRAGITDPESAQLIQADDVFMDWVTATYLNNPDIYAGKYSYQDLPEMPVLNLTEQIDQCPVNFQTRDVSQYGADIIKIDCEGEYYLRFEGSILTNILPASPHSGKYAFWSNRGDTSMMSLTREFNFSDQQAPISLSYWTWFDLEESYDYLYLLASQDGEQWEILNTPSGDLDNPNGNNYGWGYTGLSSYHQDPNTPEWIRESIDISKFAGQKVFIRFEYLTDAAVNGSGFLVDDISIPETGYFTDFESDNAGWHSEGFVRIGSAIPQSFRLVMISQGSSTSVIQYTLDGDNTINIPIKIGDGVEHVTLIVSGMTRFTSTKAAYRFSLVPK